MSYRCHERFSLYGSIWGAFDNAPDLVDYSCPPFREGIVSKILPICVYVCVLVVVVFFARLTDKVNA